MFSASLSWRDQVAMNTASGLMPVRAASRLVGSCKSAATGCTPSCSVGRRARPYTAQPAFTSAAAVALPTIPLVPTTNAVPAMCNSRIW
jgi:hypothetical protein